MAERLIIGLEDINEFWALSKSVEQDKVNANILRSQQADLQPILGSALYYEFIEDFDGKTFQTPKYDELFKGTTYNYKGNTIYFRGVRPLLSTLAYNRITDTSKVNVVRGGAVVYQVEESEIATDAQVRATKRKAYTDASRLEAELIQFLNTKKTDYPLWNLREVQSQKRTAYNFFRV